MILYHAKKNGLCSGRCAADRIRRLLISERTDFSQQMTDMVLQDVAKCAAKYDGLEFREIRCYATQKPSVLHIEIPVKKEQQMK